MTYQTVLVFSLMFCACGPDADPLTTENQEFSGTNRILVEEQFAQGRWQDALNTCSWVALASPNDCGARYCELLARTLLFVDQVNGYLLPRFRQRDSAGFGDIARLFVIDQQLSAMSNAADQVTSRGCSYDLPLFPLRIGDAQEPFLLGEVRGRHTPRGAYLLGAIANSTRYLVDNLLGPQAIPPPPAGESVPGLPTLLQKVRVNLSGHDALLFSQSTDPSRLAGGWWDRDGNGVPSDNDELLVDIFVPGTQQRVFDFSEARLVRGEKLPRGALVSTRQLPPARCDYRRWHIDTLLSGPEVGTADGMSFSPDGARIALPMKVNGLYQIHLVSADGKNPLCLTCAGATAANDGVRWRPGAPNTLLFVSNRDHPSAVGGSAGGTGQELYAMRADGSGATRLTKSPAYATNYHPNFSADGSRVVWGTTDRRTWDVMVADFVDDSEGPRLKNARRLLRDTTWTETHGFSFDGRAVLVTNTRAGFMSADIYAIDIYTGQTTRLTDDPSWDEHAHLSPNGRKLAWMSGGSRPASVLRLNDGSLSPLYDFFFINPGVFFEFLNLPSGYATELTLMDADGQNLQRLTADGLVVADNTWSPDGTRILFRQSEPKIFGSAAIKQLTFDDCR